MIFIYYGYPCKCKQQKPEVQFALSCFGFNCWVKMTSPHPGFRFGRTYLCQITMLVTKTIHSWTFLHYNCFTKVIRYAGTVGRHQQQQRHGITNWALYIYQHDRIHNTVPLHLAPNDNNMSTTRVFSANSSDAAASTKDTSAFKMKLPLTRPIHYTEAPIRSTSIYPTTEFTSMVQGRHKRAIGSLFGINNFGMNVTTLQAMTETTLNTASTDNTSKSASSSSSIIHYHTKQDEMIYIICGKATLILYDVETDTYEDILMTAGDVMGFPAGRTIGHSIRNMSTTEALTILEMGDRTKYDTAIYPEPSIDLHAKQMNYNIEPTTNADTSSDKNKGSQYHFFHKDGRLY